MDLLKSMNHRGVIKKLELSDDDFDSWLGDFGLVPQRKACKCGREMRLEVEKLRDGRAKNFSVVGLKVATKR